MNPSEAFQNAAGTPLSRRSILRIAGAAGAGVALSALLAACAPAGATGVAPTATSEPPKKGGTMRFGINGGDASVTLNPHQLNEGFGTFFSWMFYEQIRRFDGTFTPYDVLTEELTPNADATQWILRLKDGVEFHNGKTLDADDIIFSFNRILDPATAATAYGQLALIKEMTKLDAKTVRFEMAAPYGWFDLAMADTGAMGIVPVGFDVNKPVSTGPFKFVSYNPGVEAVIERFGNYHGTAPLLDSVRLVALLDNDARVNALLSNQIDITPTLPPAQAQRFLSNPAYVVNNLPSYGFTTYTMRTDSGVFADQRVREAMRLAMDRKRMVQVAGGGYATLGNDLYAPTFPAAKGLVRTRDVAKAKALIKDAGAGGKSVTLTVLQNDLVAPIIAQNAKEIGLDVNVDFVDSASFFSHGYLDYEFAMDFYPSSLQLTVAALNDGPNAAINETHFSDPEYDAEFTAATVATSADERATHERNMQKILFDRGGYLIPFFPNSLSAANANVSGLPKADETAMELAYAIGKVGFIKPPTA